MFKGRYNNGAPSRGGGRGGKRGGGSSRGGSGGFSKKSPRGLFADGIWHCECTPRLPAEHFKVKKEGANQGRWFYTCQMADPKRCGFFLWDEDAKPREEAAVLSNSRNEPDKGNRTRVATDNDMPRGTHRKEHKQNAPATPTPARTRHEGSPTVSPSPPPPYSSQTQAMKRTAQNAGFDDEDEAFDWPLIAVEEEEMAEAADASNLQTPHKAQKTGIYATPSTTTTDTTSKRKLPWLAEPTTPTSAKKSNDYFTTPSKPPPASASSTQTLPAPVTPSAVAPPTFPHSPSPLNRKKNALTNPADSSSSLTTEALSILSTTPITPDVRENLRSALSKHDLRTQGIVKGRDISRLALKAKDAKIAELQARVASLEAEREVDRGVVRKLRWDFEKGEGLG
ncbi:hypothetical protein MBLNU230_g7201t1 [Neophaeotheca triangularis]